MFRRVGAAPKAPPYYGRAAMIRGLLRTMRPHQWVKNLFVLAPVIWWMFADQRWAPTKVVLALAGFLCFSLLACAVYVLNDLVDVEADRGHPVKRHRPIASDQVSTRAARVAMAVLAIVALAGAWALGPFFLATLAGYLVNNIAYSFGLKRVAYLDVLSIAVGFELRVFAGGFAAQVEPSYYLLVVTFLLALFLGLGKRMHELVQQEASGSAVSRKVLERYNKTVVTVLLTVTGVATVATYVVYTLDPHTRTQFGTDLLVISSAFTLFGVLRFVHLVRNRPDAESPTEEMLKDIPFLANLVLWGVAIVVIITLS